MSRSLLLVFLCVSVVFGLKCYEGKVWKDSKEMVEKQRQRYHFVPPPSNDFVKHMNDPAVDLRKMVDFDEVTCRGSHTVCVTAENDEILYKGCFRQSKCNDGFDEYKTRDGKPRKISIWCCVSERCNGAYVTGSFGFIVFTLFHLLF